MIHWQECPWCGYGGWCGEDYYPECSRCGHMTDRARCRCFCDACVLASMIEFDAENPNNQHTPEETADA